MHIYFNEQELDFKVLKDKPGKKGYKLHHVPKDHPWRKWNDKLKADRKRNYLIALG